jgi:hypothetical protein
MRITRTTAAVVGIVLALSLSGCSSSGDTAEANAAYCAGAAKVQTEVDKMASLIKDGSSVELVKAQWGAVQAAIEANSVPLSQLTKSVKDDIAAADDALTQAIAAIPEGTPPAEAAPQYKAAIDAYNTSISTVETEVGCS